MIYNMLGKGEDQYYKTNICGNLFLCLDAHSAPTHASNSSVYIWWKYLYRRLQLRTQFYDNEEVLWKKL